MNKKIFLVIGFIFLVMFAGFSKYVKRGYMDRIDFDVTVRLQDNVPSRFDQLMDDGAILADPFVSSGIIIIITIIIFIKAKGVKKLSVLAIPLAFVVLTAIEIYGKTTLPHPGPPFFMVKQPTTIFPKYHVLEAYAYPSGHTARIAFLAMTSLLLIASRRKFLYFFVIFSYVLFVAVSRIYLGHHWLSDIIGGGLLGSSLGLLTAAVL